MRNARDDISIHKFHPEESGRLCGCTSTLMTRLRDVLENPSADRGLPPVITIIILCFVTSFKKVLLSWIRTYTGKYSTAIQRKRSSFILYAKVIRYRYHNTLFLGKYTGQK